jgi:hypothetical protein
MIKDKIVKKKIKKKDTRNDSSQPRSTRQTHDLSQKIEITS